MKKLHTKQKELIELLKTNSNNPLSIKDISKALEIESPGVLYHHLRQLEKKGFLKRNPNNSKDYVVLDSPENSVIYIAKYGMAQCGPSGSILEESPIEHVAIASSLIRFPASEAFIVEAKGDSMEPKIKNGDIIIARKHITPVHGDIIVCVHNLEAKIKKFSQINGVVSLVSENHNKYHPVNITEEGELRIEGVVKNILNYS
jgi:repressor LexA